MGNTGRDRSGEVDGEEDSEDEEIEDKRNDIVIWEQDKVHSLGGYFM